MDDNRIFIKPAPEIIKIYVRWLCIVLGVFGIIYYSANAYASTQEDLYHLYWDWELQIPLIPPMIIIYLSYVVIFVMLLFIFKSPDAIRGLAYSMLAALIVSGLVFVIFPGHLGYVRPEAVPGYQLAYSVLYQLDKPHNLYPSLHVAFAALAVFSLIHQTDNARLNVFLWMWFALICASVILTHQHHVFDIITGYALAWLVYKMIYLRMAGPPHYA